MAAKRGEDCTAPAWWVDLANFEKSNVSAPKSCWLTRYGRGRKSSDCGGAQTEQRHGDDLSAAHGQLPAARRPSHQRPPSMPALTQSHRPNRTRRVGDLHGSAAVRMCESERFATGTADTRAIVTRVEAGRCEGSRRQTSRTEARRQRGT